MVYHVALLIDQLIANGSLHDYHRDEVIKSVESLNLADAELFLLNGLVSKPDLLRALSDVYQVPYFDARGYQFNHDLLELFYQDFLLKWMVIPIKLEEDIMTVVAGDPSKDGLLQAFDECTDYTVELRVGIIRDIIDEARAYYELPPQDEMLVDENSDFDSDTADIVE